MTGLKRSVLLLALLCSLHLPPAVAARSLVLWVYPHDELKAMSDDELHHGYLQHWLDEMRSFTHHPIEIVIRRNVPEVTDIDYRSAEAENTLLRLHEAVQEIRRINNYPSFFQNRYILLTKDNFGNASLLTKVEGMAHFAQFTAMASLRTYTNFAHEVGHLLGATHEASEVNYNGWFCETYMTPTRFDLRSHCYRYSDENRKIITQHLAEKLGR